MQLSDSAGGAPSILPYFRDEWKSLAVVTVSGILYNAGAVAGPWLEGQMAQCLADILEGRAHLADMAMLAAAYVLAISFIQLMRAVKRLWVRRFANDVDLSMKKTLYRSLLQDEGGALSGGSIGEVMTKALSDVDDCVEGMRKFTTELFDTGVVMVVYVAALFASDWKIALLALAFPPISYILAAALRRTVTEAVAAAKHEVSDMAEGALERVSAALTLRAFGLEGVEDGHFEECLARYEKAETKANVLSSSLMPIYQSLALLGTVPVFVLGARNVEAGIWNIASFTMFFSVFCRLAEKSSHAAKLFNAVQRAQVSWKRIQGYLGASGKEAPAPSSERRGLAVEHLTCGWPGEEPLAGDVSFRVAPGEIVGVTGEVASGKTTLVRAILGELPCQGSVTPKGPGIFSFLGHDPELLDASIADNVALGCEGDIGEALRLACLEDEVAALPRGAQTLVGEGAERLSGGQRQRLGLARTYFHVREVAVLDDPFSALDAATEREAFRNLCAWAHENQVAVVVVSHRLSFFPELSGIVFLHDGTASVGTHQQLMERSEAYRKLFCLTGKEDA